MNYCVAKIRKNNNGQSHCRFSKSTSWICYPEVKQIVCQNYPNKTRIYEQDTHIRQISSGKAENVVLAARDISLVTGQNVLPENVRSGIEEVGPKLKKTKKKLFL